MSNSSRTAPTLYRKTLTTLLAVAALVALTGGFLGTRALERRAIGHLQRALTVAIRLMESEVLNVLNAPTGVPATQPLVIGLGQRAGCRVTVIDPTGVVLGDSEQPEENLRRMENHKDRPEVQAALAGGIGTSLRYSETVRHPMLYVALPLMDRGSIRGVLRASVPMTAVTELRQEIRLTVIASLLIGCVVAIALGVWLARRVIRPLSRLTLAARAYAKGDLTTTAEDAPVREVRELAEALNAMAQAHRTHIDELTAERNQATAILESMAEGVIALDPQGRILLINPAARMLLGAAAAKAVGQSVFEILRNQEAQALLQSVLQNRERGMRDIALFQPKERVLRLHGVPCQDSGTGSLTIVVIQDVTESNRYEQLRKEFVANVSHELKSPLTSIRSLTETLLGGALDEPANNRRFLQLIDGDALRLSRLIDDLLALSQIESQAVPLTLSVVTLRPLAESVLASLQPVLTQRQIATALEIPASLEVRADPDRLRQVVFNLVDNAIKYNKNHGRIVISADGKEAWATVSVTDTGIGIPGNDLPRIFERFYRVDKARSRELGGTGLGLAIVKHIVEAHGGAVSVESEPKRGSKFSFTIPLAS